MNKYEFIEKVRNEQLDTYKYNIDYNPIRENEIGVIINDKKYLMYLSDEH